ncbi:MAG: PAS domain S-box protein [Pelagibacteraceae bacterium]
MDRLNSDTRYYINVSIILITAVVISGVIAEFRIRELISQKFSVAPADVRRDVLAAIDKIDGTRSFGVTSDMAGHIVQVSAAIKPLLEWEPEQLIGKPINVLIPPNFQERHHTAFDRRKSEGTTTTSATLNLGYVLAADGRSVQARLVVEDAISDTHGRVFIARITLVD